METFKFTTDMAEMAKTVAAERGIEADEVYEAMESAIAKAGKLRYGDLNIRATIDREHGNVVMERYLEVVEDEEFTEPDKQITLKEAQKQRKDIKLGEPLILDELPPVDFGRVAVQAAKQVIFQKVRESSRKKQYEEYKDKVGEIINGIVRRVEFGNLVVDLGTAEAVVRRNQLLGREIFHRGDRLRAYITDVREEKHGPQIFLSRSDTNFISGLFKQEVPEIYDGIVEIKGVVHEPGSRAKIAVSSQDSAIDPVGACVGMRGSRVQAVVNELQGEKIDIIPWSPDPATFVVNAMAPVEVLKVIIDEETNTIEAVVPAEQLSLAIGRRGQNVRLASMLVGWGIDIISEEDREEKTKKEIQESNQFLMKALNVDDVITHLLVSEGIRDVAAIARMSIEELTAIEGVNGKLAEELKTRSDDWLVTNRKELTDKLKQLKFQTAVINLFEDKGLSLEQMVTLAEKGITDRDKLAELANDELSELLPEIRRKAADEIIMKAREHWFKDEIKPEAEVKPEVKSEAEVKPGVKPEAEVKPEVKPEAEVKPGVKPEAEEKKTELEEKIKQQDDE